MKENELYTLIEPVIGRIWAYDGKELVNYFEQQVLSAFLLREEMDSKPIRIKKMDDAEYRMRAEILICLTIIRQLLFRGKWQVGDIQDIYQCVFKISENRKWNSRILQRAMSRVMSIRIPDIQEGHDYN